MTGAARGLGWGIARAFGIAGARVCVTDIRDELARCARDLAADGTEFLRYRSDVADLAECTRVVNSIVDRFGRLDVVVHNAIYMPLVSFDATTPAEWARQIDVGIGGLFNCTHAVWNQMKAQGVSHIIGIASGSNEAHLRRVLRGYIGYYNTARPHQSLDNTSPRPRDVQRPALGRVVAIPQIGGLHHIYQRAA